MTKKYKSFTLIEMLIVIVIIGILAAALVPRLMDVQSRARDAKRKTDLLQMYNGLTIYYEDNAIYPVLKNTNFDCTTIAVSGYVVCNLRSTHNNATGWIPNLIPSYMTSLPVDPLNTIGTYTGAQGGPWSSGYYVYSYMTTYPRSPDGNKRFGLFTRLENLSDPDRCELKLYKVNLQGYPGTFNCGFTQWNSYFGFSYFSSPYRAQYIYYMGNP